MFGFRTPAKEAAKSDLNKSPQGPEIKSKTERAGPSLETHDRTFAVRRSIGQIEARTTPTISQKSPSQSSQEVKAKGKPAPAKPDSKTGTQKNKTMATTIADGSPKQAPKYSSRTAEAEECFLKAKLHLGNRNLKSEIKTEVIDLVERLYNLVKKAEEDKMPRVVEENKKEDQTEKKKEDTLIHEMDMIKHIEEHTKRIKENKEEMEKLQIALKKQQEILERKVTYASIAAGSPRRQSPETAAMHSVVITSKNIEDSGEEVYEKVRQIINAKEEGAKIDKIRRARDRKVILGCRSQEEMKKIKNRITERGEVLNVEEIQNKDPLIILFGVCQYNSDEDVIRALKVQNKHLLRDVSEQDSRIEIRYRRKARNPLTSHIVAKVSPPIWQCLTGAGAVHIDVQRVRVADQSPLIQCSRCLGYGHGKRFCRDAIDVCSHCGGSHLRTECAEWLANAPPSCINCTKTKMERTDHSAFSSDCPVRRKWETLARSTVAYC